jgi:hypothetical protein
MIIIGTSGKTLATTGLQGVDWNELKEKIRQIDPRNYQVHLENYSIQLNDENLLGIEIQNQFYPFSLNALKSLCKLIKVPAAYLNKLISNDLTLKNINENPLKLGVELTATIWKDDEDQESSFIAGFSSGASMNSMDVIDLIEVSGMLEKNDLELHHWIYMPEYLILNFLQKEIFEVNENQTEYTYQLGISVYFSETTDQPFQIVPFYHIRLRLPNGEWMEWDFETRRIIGKAGKRSRSFSGEVQKLITDFEIGKLSTDFLQMKLLVESSQAVSEVRFKVLKSLYSAAKSIFTHYTLPDTGIYVKSEIFPEFDHFKTDNKERMKEMEPFQIANLLAPISLPVIYNRIYFSNLLLENPHFMMKARNGIYKMMYIAAEEANLII